MALSAPQHKSYLKECSFAKKLFTGPEVFSLRLRYFINHFFSKLNEVL